MEQLIISRSFPFSKPSPKSFEEVLFYLGSCFDYVSLLSYHLVLLDMQRNLTQSFVKERFKSNISSGLIF